MPLRPGASPPDFAVAAAALIRAQALRAVQQAHIGRIGPDLAGGAARGTGGTDRPAAGPVDSDLDPQSGRTRTQSG